MPPRKNRSKRKNAAPPPTQTLEQTVVAKPSTENDAHSKTHHQTTLSLRGSDVRYVCYICDYYMIRREDGPYLYPPDLIVLQTELSLKGLDTNATTRTEHG